ncbi:MAG: hypothetical protein KDB90_03375 [Planctomycetes bacterium]|nr:hypothetical protein [Planctomycetota bacterium]
MPDDNEKAEQYLRTARKIRRASSASEIASAVISGVSDMTPKTAVDWRRRAFARRAIEAALHGLQISIEQHAIASIELASDLRIGTCRQIVRLLSGLAGHEDSLPVAELAVATVAPGAETNSLVRASQQLQSNSAKTPLAVSSLGGQLLVSTSALEFAAARGVDETSLHSILGEAAAPVRRACAAVDTCQVGELRFSRILPDLDMTVVAQLDGSAGGRPVIRLTLGQAASPPQAARLNPAPLADEAYPARLLRRLVS